MLLTWPDWKNVHYDRDSEAYRRVDIDFLIIASIVKHVNLPKQSQLPTEQSHPPIINHATTIVPVPIPLTKTRPPLPLQLH